MIDAMPELEGIAVLVELSLRCPHGRAEASLLDVELVRVERDALVVFRIRHDLVTLDEEILLPDEERDEGRIWYFDVKTRSPIPTWL